ncbi:MAG: YceI family protein [Hyphomicrobiales bacterium]|nr:YceI family protein [Hyphomicrobiales bacterium]
MAATPSSQRRLIHWLSGALVIVAIGVGLWMVRQPTPGAAGVANVFWWFSLHKTIGVTILALTVWRLFAAWRDPFTPAAGRPIEEFLASSVQGFMLCALVLLPLLGLWQHALIEGAAPIWLMPDGWLHWMQPNPELSRIIATCHRVLAWGLTFAIALHLAGAFKQHFIAGNSVVKNMVWGANEPLPDKEPMVAGRAAAVSAGCAAAILLVLVTAFAPTKLANTASFAPRPTVAASKAQKWEWTLDHAKSKLTIVAKHDGQEFSANFARFDAKIVFDPANPQDATIEARIDSKSFISGLPDRDEITRKGDWLDAKGHPHALWKSTAVAREPDGSYLAQGRLTIRGVSTEVPLRFTLKIEKQRATATGTTSFDRRKIQLGRGEYTDTDKFHPRVTVRIHIEATRGDGKI